ncbi:MAG: methylenetetrahydrofolate reductase C-terminal domain-containing protein [archaeon]|nr:methylenetetrahydrofolate reductase C-terminal domain-containing protein [archaeon]
MIAQEQKPIEEILGYLEGKNNIVIVGCGGCATFYHTGDKKAVDGMADKLEKEGKKVTKIYMPFSMQVCETEKSGVFLNKKRKALEDCDAVLVMSCGDGVQVATEYIEEGMGLMKGVYPANNAIGLVGGGPTKFKETCLSCGMCELGKTAGICPLTSCGKGLMNGPCGGVRVDNKCEIDPEKDCAWVKIYERMEKLGELDKFLEMRAPHEWSKCKRPRLFEIEEPVNMMSAMIGAMPGFLTYTFSAKPKLGEKE